MTCLPHWPTDETSDPGLRLFTLSRCLLPAIPVNGSVLEIGYRDTPWATWCRRADPSLTVTAIDWRTPMPQEGVETLQGDILQQAWPRGSFDVIVGLSTFEHIGLGHYEGDPIHVDGDIALAQKVRDWLTPGGWCYFDVPYAPEGYYVKGTKCRVYDDAHLFERFGPVQVVGYTLPSVTGWIEKPTRNCDAPKPYYYVACVIRA